MKKKTKLIKKIMLFCIIVIVLEVLTMIVMKVIRERYITHIDSLNDVIMVDDYYIGVGISDFANSEIVNQKYYSHKNEKTGKSENILATQAKITKYDKDMNTIWENTIEGKYDSSFYSVLKVEDGYLAVGSYISKYEQIDANTRDAILVKYDLDGKQLWQKDYSVLSDTEFYKIIADDDNYVIVGQSIYENMEMGTHVTGGGIITRYDKEGNLLAHNNYGGNKSGSFNDVIKVDDGYIVCGKDATNYGIVVKFKKDFDREENDYNMITKKILWNRTYSNTDNVGFTSMIKIDNTIYAAGAINVSKEKDEEDNPIYKYDAGIVLYNTNGKYLSKYSLKEDIHHRFNSVINEDNNLVLTGLIDVDNHYNDERQDSFLIKFDLAKNEFSDIKIIQEKNDYIINKIKKLDNDNYLIGTSKSNCSLYGCEYESFIKEYK